MRNLVSQPSINILEEKLQAAGLTKPTDKVLWVSCIIEKIKNRKYKQTINGTCRLFRNKPTKLEKKSAKKLTHQKRYYWHKAIIKEYIQLCVDLDNLTLEI